MTEDLATIKLKHLRGLSDFASDTALRFMVEAELPYAILLNRIADTVIGGAGYEHDETRLVAALNALVPADRAELERLLAETSILQRESQVPKDAAQELDGALNYHWPKNFGFDGPAAARAELGEDVAATIDKFVHAKADEFWKRDALAEEIDKSVLSEKDMRIIVGFGAGSTLDKMAERVSSFVNDELLRACLLAGGLLLPLDAVARPETGLNGWRYRFRPDWPPVSLTEWLA